MICKPRLHYGSLSLRICILYYQHHRLHIPLRRTPRLREKRATSLTKSTSLPSRVGVPRKDEQSFGGVAASNFTSAQPKLHCEAPLRPCSAGHHNARLVLAIHGDGSHQFTRRTPQFTRLRRNSPFSFLSLTARSASNFTCVSKLHCPTGTTSLALANFTVPQGQLHSASAPTLTACPQTAPFP